MVVDSYKKTILETSSERQSEAQALIATARRLKEAFDAQDRDALVAAVTINYRLWLFFYSQIETKQVVLPPEVERNIINLVAYVVKVSPRAFAAEEAVINTLVSINRNIAAGLSENLEGESLPQTVPSGSTVLSA